MLYILILLSHFPFLITSSHVRSSHLKEKHDINTVLEEGGVFPGELDVHVYPPLDVHVHPPLVVVEELQVCQKK